MEQKEFTRPVGKPAQLDGSADAKVKNTKIDGNLNVASAQKEPPVSPTNPLANQSQATNSNQQPKKTEEKIKKTGLKSRLNSIDISFRVSLEEKVFLAKNLSVILKSGISLPESLTIVTDQSKGKLKKVLTDIVGKVNSGKSLNVALSNHKDVFDPLFINMVKVGEKSGTLDQSLTYLADQLTRDSKLISKIKSASLYPTIVVITAVVVGGGISYFILPKLTKLFSSFKTALPLSTRILLWFSKNIEENGVLWLGLVIMTVILVLILQKIKKIRGIWQQVVLSLPIIGRLSKSLNLARFSLILGTLLKNSVSIDEALIIVSGAIDSAPYQKIIQQVQLEVRQGKTVLEGIEIHDHKSKLFDPTTRAMIRVGEKTGNLSNSLLYISEYFQEEVDNITKDLATSLEPILLILIALVVGFIAISIITPMYSILNVINR
jgi:type IV pilus assembly protein PilC